MPTDTEYEVLLGFRDALRRFDRWSAEQAEAAGLTPAQHQVLLVVRAHPEGPTVGEIADHLLLRHHSAVGLVDRCEQAGLVHRVPDARDHRLVRVRLTRTGAARIRRLAAAHLEELRRLAPVIGALG